MKNSLILALLVALCAPGVAQNRQLVLGNPSKATSSVSKTTNFLVIHNGFILSYNKRRGAPNWVAWHLSASDLGPIDRTNAFREDPDLPEMWQIKDEDYDGSGFDRGHMCPSEDRSNSEEANRETFLMSNMQPQFHHLNAGVWKAFEGYLQRQVRDERMEAYIYAGCVGNQGTVNDEGKVRIPVRCWKIALLLEEGTNDLRRINANTRVIAVEMPNDETSPPGWSKHRVTVNRIETLTRYNFLSVLPNALEEKLESRKDSVAIQ